MMRWFNDVRVVTKLLIGFTPVLLLLCIIGWLGYSGTTTATDAAEEIYARHLTGIDLARRIEIDRLKIGRAYRDGSTTNDRDQKEANIRDIETFDAEMGHLLDEMDKTIVLQQTRDRAVESRRLLSEYAELARRAVQISETNPEQSKAAREKASPVGNRARDLLNEVVRSKVELARSTFLDASARGAWGRHLVLVMTIGAVLSSALIAWQLARAMGGPLDSAVRVLDRVAQGDLTSRLAIEQKDEIGRMAAAVNSTVESMVSTLTGVQRASQEVSSASRELASASQHISSGAQEQAASLEETAASLEQISSTVRQNADNAEEAAKLASSAREAAERGGAVMQSALDAMNEITRSSKQIGEIITAIDEIAFQTNLLALNAAVEAARAGEQGRGFGVVASEVRTLAQRTASAAKEIRGLIADSSQKVQMGTAQVNQSGAALDEIVRSVRRVTDMVVEIVAASREQRTGVDQVSDAVTQVDKVTQSNAAQTEQVAATANSLSSKAEDLEQLVATFNIGALESALPNRGQMVAELVRPPRPAPNRRSGPERTFAKVKSPSLLSRRTAGRVEEF